MVGKLPGQKLSFDQLGGIVGVPPEFIAEMQLHEEVTPVPNNVPPDTLSDTVFFSRCETNETGERTKHTYFKKAGNIVLQGTNTDADGQPVQMVRTLFPTGTTATLPDAFTKVGVQDLGNGWSIQEVSVEGMYVAGVFTPQVFSNVEYSTGRPLVIPEEFRSLAQTLEVAQTTAGIASQPTLGTGDLRKVVTQVTEYTIRTDTTTINLSVLPITLLSVRTNAQKQTVSVSSTLQVDTGTYPSPTALQDVNTRNIGAGLVVVDVSSTTDVFAANSYTVQITDPTPAEFRALVATSTTEYTEAGTAGVPTLGTGDLRVTQTEVTEFTRRVERTTLSITGTLTLVVSELIEGNSVTITNTLKAGSQSFTATAYTLDGSLVRDLGNGFTLMTVRSLTSYPTLQGQRTDPRFGLALPFTSLDQSPASAAAYLGQINKEIIPKTALLSEVRDNTLSTAATAALDAYSKSLPNTVARVNGIPDVLVAVNVEWNTSNGQGDANEVGNASSIGVAGTLSIQLPASAQASASIIPSVTPLIVTFDIHNRPVVDYYFFMPDNSTVAQVFARLNTLVGGTVNPWPIFQPVSHTIVCKGEKVALRVSATTRLSVSFSPSSVSLARSQGNSGDLDVTAVSQTVTIRPTIHGDVIVGAVENGASTPPATIGPSSGVTLGTTSSVATITATATSNLSNWGLSASRTASLTAKASVSPGKLSATPGTSAIPSSGLYLMDLNAEPFRESRTLVRARVFDFASLTTLNASAGLGTNVTPDAVTVSGLPNTPVLVGVNASSNNTTFTSTAPPAITVDVANQAVAAGTNVTFGVTATGASPLTYQWSENGVAIAGATASSYTIQNAGSGNAGTYNVVVSNNYGSVSSRNAILTVGQAPGITTQPASQTANVGNAVTFTVVATGSAPLAYQWSKGTVAISGATASSYTIASVAASNAGIYTVRVTNPVGAITSAGASLSVSASSQIPQIVQQPTGGNYNLGDTLSLTVAVTGSTPLSYQWYINGSAITSGATSATYTASSINENYAGTYTVVVSNSLGSVTSNGAVVTVAQTTPVINSISPVQRLKSTGDNTVYGVTVNATGDGLYYQWYASGNYTGDSSFATSDSYALSGGTGATYSFTADSIASSAGSLMTNPGFANVIFKVKVSNSAGFVVGQAQVLVVPSSAPNTPTMSFSSPIYHDSDFTVPPRPSFIQLGVKLDTVWTEDLTFSLTHNYPPPAQSSPNPFNQQQNQTPVYPATITIPKGTLGGSNGNGANAYVGGSTFGQSNPGQLVDYQMTSADYPGTGSPTSNPTGKAMGYIKFTVTGPLTQNGTTLSTLTATNDVPVPSS